MLKLIDPQFIGSSEYSAVHELLTDCAETVDEAVIVLDELEEVIAGIRKQLMHETREYTFSHTLKTALEWEHRERNECPQDPEGNVVYASLGDAIFARSADGFVADFLGGRWEVTIERDWSGGVPILTSVRMSPTADAEPTKSDPRPALCSVQFLGTPTAFRQEEFTGVIPGCTTYMLAFINSGWGDCGVEHIFLAVDSKNRPVGIYYTADCY